MFLLLSRARVPEEQLVVLAVTLQALAVAAEIYVRHTLHVPFALPLGREVLHIVEVYV